MHQNSQFRMSSRDSNHLNQAQSNMKIELKELAQGETVGHFCNLF